MTDLGQLDAITAKRKMKTFVRRVWRVVEPTTTFIPNWHIDLICTKLEALERGELKRVIFNVPPGSMKSLLKVMFIAWVWSRDASKRFIQASYGSHLSIRDNVRLRDIVMSRWYQENFPHVKFTGDQNAKERFNTTAGGWCIATSVGGVGTGEHPHFIFIDDPLTAQQAKSEAERQAAIDWIEQTLSTRGVALDVRVVLIMQRLHMKDPSGYLLGKESGYQHVMIPMRFEAKRAIPEDPRTTEGQLLWPELFTEAKVRALEIDLNPYGAAGQLQQRPAPLGGGLFKEDWFAIVEADAVPKNARRARGWDTAATAGDGDWTAGVRLAVTPQATYIEDVQRGQWSSGQVDDTLAATAAADGRAVRQREEREPGSAGVAVVTARAVRLRGYDYKAVSASGDKVVRSGPFRAEAERGRVKLVRGAWNRAYIDELCVFPNGENDDQVDGTSAAYNSLMSEPAPMQTVQATWG